MVRGRVLRVRDAIAQRRLAGDERAGSWARAEATRRERAFVRAHWRRFTALIVVAAGAIAGIAFALPHGFVRGLGVGVLSTAVVAALTILTREFTGTSSTWVGATAEQWTASELRPLRKSGRRLINHLPRRSGELDHLLVGPAGVAVVETKWSRSRWKVDNPDQYLTKALQQVKNRSRELEFNPQVKQAGCAVRPVLFLWSAEGSGVREDAPTYSVIEGVTVIRGRDVAGAWRHQVTETPAVIDTTQIETLALSFAEQLVDDDAREAARAPVPVSFEQIFSTPCACLAAGVGGIIAMLEPLSHRLDPLPKVLIGIALAAAGLVGRRWRRGRLAADAWLAGVVGVAALAVVIGILGQ